MVPSNTLIKLSVLSLLLIITDTLFAQKNNLNDYTVIKQSDWVIPKNDTLDYAFDSYQNSKALLLKRKVANYKSASIAYPQNLNFKNGIIEADIAWPGKQNGFVGLAFHIEDPHHYEVVYFRPESSGTINAIQYMPEKQAEFNWWNYEANKYQAKTILPMHDWFHVKLVVKGNTVTVFVNHGTNPSMVYKELDNSLKQGSVGFWLGNSEEGAYKNLKVSAL